MKNLLNAIMRLFKPEVKPTGIVDTTVYCIETTTKKYCGRIIFQDDVMIRLRGTRFKTVKILKCNIERIVIVDNDSVKHYQQWLTSKTQFRLAH